MGQIITTAEQKRIVESNVRAFTKQATEVYAGLFGKSPTFVTYYSLDMGAGGYDPNLGAGVHVVGPKSPLRYKEVASFPIYGISEADVQRAYDDVTGVATAEVEGELYVLPDTMEPAENDFFVVEYLETPLMFRVSGVTPDRIEGKTFFKVSYYLDETSPEEILPQVTGEYDFEMRNAGTSVSPIVSRATTLALRELEIVIEALKGRYWAAFYDRRAGTVLLRPGPASVDGSTVYDRALEIFLDKNDVLTSPQYLSSRPIRRRDFGDRGLFEDTVYRRTIYSVAERGTTPWPSGILTSALLAETRASDAAHPFFGLFAAAESYYDVLPGNSTDTGAYHPGGPDFGSMMLLTDLGESTETSKLALLARKCLAGKFRGETTALARAGIVALTTALNDDELLADREQMFWLLPITLREAERLRTSRAIATQD